MLGIGFQLDSEPMNTTVPVFCLRMYGRKALVTLSALNIFVVNWCRVSLGLTEYRSAQEALYML